MTDTMMPDFVAIPHVLLRPLPLRVREHPERSARARVTLVREVLVPFAAGHPPILEALRRVTGAPLLVDALESYMRAADKAAQVIGLAHRRDLLVRDDGPLPVRHDRSDVLALAQLEPATLESWAVATAVLHVALDRAPYAAELQPALARIAPLAMATEWLMLALTRWSHLRLYEILFGPFEVDRELTARVPPEWEAHAVVQAAGPPRMPLDRAPKGPDGAFTLAYQVKAWWAIHVEHETTREIIRRWHAYVERPQHAAQKSVEECGCRTTVRRGVKEVGTLLLSRA